MTDAVTISLVNAGAFAFTAVMSFVNNALSRRNARKLIEVKELAERNHAEVKAEVTAVAQKVDETHKEINGRMSQLLIAAKAQGAQDQRAETRQDAKDEKAEAKS